MASTTPSGTPATAAAAEQPAEGVSHSALFY